MKSWRSLKNVLRPVIRIWFSSLHQRLRSASLVPALQLLRHPMPTWQISSKYMVVQTIGHDKLNQLRHVRFFRDRYGVEAQMRRHADILRPKFEMVEQTLEDELGGLEIGTWTKPLGGYFISFDALEGCAKAIVAKAKEAGVVMTGAGATFPYGKDPKDSNIRIAPSYPTVEELAVAAKLFALCVKLVSVEKILESK